MSVLDSVFGRDYDGYSISEPRMYNVLRNSFFMAIAAYLVMGLLLTPVVRVRYYIAPAFFSLQGTDSGADA